MSEKQEIVVDREVLKHRPDFIWFVWDEEEGGETIAFQDDGDQSDEILDYACGKEHIAYRVRDPKDIPTYTFLNALVALGFIIGFTAGALIF